MSSFPFSISEISVTFKARRREDAILSSSNCSTLEVKFRIDEVRSLFWAVKVVFCNVMSSREVCSVNMVELEEVEES